jgi:hypothetical protein
MNARFAETQMLIGWGPVCRPDCLIEIEAIAITPHEDVMLPAY